MRSRGFTLIELLVVIAIIAILAAILFPVFSRAREKARQTSCLSNVKQICLGMQMYTQDYDEHWPAFFVGAGSHIGGGAGTATTRAFGYYDVIVPYVMNEQVYICPSGKWRSNYGRTDLPPGEGPMKEYFVASYGAPTTFDTSSNYPYFGGLTVWEYSGEGRMMAKIAQPAQTIVLVESWSNVFINSTAACGFDRVGSNQVAQRQMDDHGRVGNMAYRHNRTMNVGFADGHAKAHQQFTSMHVFNINAK